MFTLEDNPVIEALHVARETFIMEYTVTGINILINPVVSHNKTNNGT